jgi:two-component system, cell cycle response regulator
MKVTPHWLFVVPLQTQAPMQNERLSCPHAVVLIEDDPNVSLMLARHLERAGCSVRTAGSVQEARQSLRESEWDLVLVDRGLPDGDGIALCEEIRAAQAHGYIMILTGAASDADKMRGFESGADDYVTKPFNIEELIARVRAGLRIVDLQKALFASNRRLEEMSLTDDLTGLRNRRSVEAELNTRFGLAMRHRRAFAVAMVDVDHFKLINDSHGHQTGDAVLKGVASLLRRGTRLTDLAGRVGGEEFCILLPETALFEAIQFGEKIRALIASEPVEGLPVTVSVGVASMPHSAFTSTDEIVYAADQALYRAKQRGRNRVESEKRYERFARKSPPPPHVSASINASA